MTDYSKKSGFTLIELLVVIVLLALIAGSAGGIYLGTYKRAQAEAIARDLGVMLKYAGITAIEKQRPCKVYLDNDQKRFFCAVETFDQMEMTFEQTIISNEYCKPKTLPDSITFEKIAIMPYGRDDIDQQRQQSLIVFNPNGTCDQAAIQIGDGKNSFTIVLSSICRSVEITDHKLDEIETKIIDLDIAQ